MERWLRYAAYLANIVLIGSSMIMVLHNYGQDSLLASLLAVPPILSLFSLYFGPDAEERQLSRDVNKARLRKELKDLTGGKH
jgi:hypothetical protein